MAAACAERGAALVEVAVGQPCRHGAADPVVLSRLSILLRELGWSARRPEQRAAVAEQLARLRATAAGQDLDAEGTGAAGSAG